MRQLVLKSCAAGATKAGIIHDNPEMNSSYGEITELLLRISAGERSAENALLPLVYAELHRQASARMRRERPGHTLHATDLVHEVYLKLCGGERNLCDRVHFFRLAAWMMRNILVDHARRRKAQRRGAAARPVALNESLMVSEADLSRAVEIDDLLRRLAETRPRQAQVVEMRFFAGLDETEIALALGIDKRTVRRDWLKARAWLHGQVYGE